MQSRHSIRAVGPDPKLDFSRFSEVCGAHERRIQMCVIAFSEAQKQEYDNSESRKCGLPAANILGTTLESFVPPATS